MGLIMTLPIHIPVLLKEAIEALRVEPGKLYIDCTIGLGGHAAAILERSTPGGRLLGIDADPKAVKFAKDRLRDYSQAVILVNDNFANLDTICTKYNFFPVDGILFDLGVSSHQLDTAERGFSFQRDAPLDMRFDPNQELTAADIVNSLAESQLAHLIQQYGGEHYSRKIARRIVQQRPITTTLQLARVVTQTVGGRRGRIHPATRTFLALRLAVNDELENLAIALKKAVRLLDSRGRLVIISYHSLEDRLVKEFLKRETMGCLCPLGTPVCGCGHTATLKLVSKKVITPSPVEIAFNPRCRSAKLRIAEHL